MWRDVAEAWHASQVTSVIHPALLQTMAFISSDLVRLSRGMRVHARIRDDRRGRGENQLRGDHGQGRRMRKWMDAKIHDSSYPKR